MANNSIHERAGILRDVVFAADDGIITTFAIAAGSAGAGLSPSVVIILGFANIIADGISMATGVYLGVKSELEYEKIKGDTHYLSDSPVRHGMATFVSFTLGGLLPLIPYLFRFENYFLSSTIVVGVSLFGIGALKALYTKKSWAKSGLEVLLIGSIAAFAAFGVGYLIDKFIV